MIDIRTGAFRFVAARAVLLATGGGPTMYRYHTPSGDKSMDGLAMALRAGLPLRDMEMVQFHPTGLFAGPDTRMTGTVLEEGLRGAGGYLLNGAMHRFMGDYDESSSARPATSSAAPCTPRCGPGAPRPTAGSTSRWATSAPTKVRRQFKGMVERCGDCGFDLAGGLVEVVPTAHYFMGGVVCRADTSTERPGPFRRRRGCERHARRQPARRQRRRQLDRVRRHRRRRDAALDRRQPGHREPDEARARRGGRARAASVRAAAGDLNDPRRLLDAMWDDVGVMRDRAGLDARIAALDESRRELLATGLADDGRAFNLTWHDWLNLRSLIEISRVIALAARKRENSRGAHFRSDFPEPGELAASRFTVARGTAAGIEITDEPVAFTHVRPGETLLKDQAAAE